MEESESENVIICETVPFPANEEEIATSFFVIEQEESAENCQNTSMESCENNAESNVEIPADSENAAMFVEQLMETTDSAEVDLESCDTAPQDESAEVSVNPGVVVKEVDPLACPHCPKKFNRLQNKQRHVRLVHKVPGRSQGTHIKCIECNMSFQVVFRLRDHLSEVHKLKMDEEEMHFPNMNAFKKWKAEMERKTLCSFTLRHGTKKGVLGARYFYSCHRSGKYAPKRKGPRQRMIKLQGSCKMGICCTAAIQAQETPNGVMVKFCPYHYGHGKETTYIKLTPEERVAIEESVEKGVPFETLLSEIRENKSSKDHFQLFLLKKKDIRSINNSYAYEEFNTEMSDADSVDRWISLCCQMEVSPILFYQKEDFVGGEGKHDEFLLVIMTEFQRQILLNSARQIVCVDSLYRKKGGRFYLTVMFIMDEMDLAFPVAFCISNKVDKMVLIQFYASISQQTGPLECQYFMSDSESHYYEAWKEVMNDESKWIWSLWYVDSRFRTQLKIFKGDTQKRQDVYKVLRVLLECPNQIVFTCMFENLIKDLMASPTSKDLGKFIQSKYGSNFEMWARCYQKDIELGTVIHLEIMHRTLRYCCREGRKTRLDKFIYVLMKLIRDKMLDRLSNVLDEEKITMAVEAINTCHTMGLEIVPENITVLSDKIWLVRAENPDENAYVTVDNATCLEHCNLKCIECDICVHMYSCTCLNNLINANMCDHIHAVVYNFITPHFSPPASDVDDIMQEVADTSSEVVEMFQKEESYEELLQSVLKRSHQVYKLIQASRNSLNSSSLTKLLNKMNDCVDICTGKYKEPEPPKFPPAVPTFPFPVVSSVPRPAASLPTACRSMPSNGTSLPRSPAPVPFSSASSSSSGPTPSTSTAPVSLLSPNPTNPTQPGAVAVTNINSAPGGKPVYVLQPVYGNNASVAPTQILQGPFLRGPQGQIIQASNIVQSATGGQYIVVMQDKAK